MDQGRPSSAPAEISFRLSWPPSVNHSFRSATNRRFVHNSKARQWRLDAATEAMIQRVPRERLMGSLSIEILAIPPDRRVRDLDNLLKPTLDALTAAGIIADDRFVDEIRIRRGRPDAPGRLVVTIRQKGA